MFETVNYIDNRTVKIPINNYLHKSTLLPFNQCFKNTSVILPWVFQWLVNPAEIMTFSVCITWEERVWCMETSGIYERSYGSWRTCPAAGLKTHSPPHLRPCHSPLGLAPAAVSCGAQTQPHPGQEGETSRESICMYYVLWLDEQSSATNAHFWATFGRRTAGIIDPVQIPALTDDK